MLSHYHKPIDGCKVGSHPEISKMMKGIFNTIPPLPKLAPKWDLDIILEALKKPPFEPLESLSLELLTLKACFLFALCTAKRGDDISKFSIAQNYFISNPEQMIFLPTALLKQGKGKQTKLQAFEKDKKICPVTTLRHYLKVTEELRGECTSLFITHGFPYHSPKPLTINRWIVEVIS